MIHLREKSIIEVLQGSNLILNLLTMNFKINTPF